MHCKLTIKKIKCAKLRSIPILNMFKHFNRTVCVDNERQELTEQMCRHMLLESAQKNFLLT